MLGVAAVGLDAITSGARDLARGRSDALFSPDPPIW
jgi:hypothetical protein